MNMHCELCGRENPPLFEGYTACCKQLACFGEQSYRFGTETENVRACCWAKAFKRLEAEGRPVPDRGRCLG